LCEQGCSGIVLLAGYSVRQEKNARRLNFLEDRRVEKDRRRMSGGDDVFGFSVLLSQCTELITGVICYKSEVFVTAQQQNFRKSSRKSS
jgi:hypothetical protein